MTALPVLCVPKLSAKPPPLSNRPLSLSPERSTSLSLSDLPAVLEATDVLAATPPPLSPQGGGRLLPSALSQTSAPSLHVLDATCRGDVHGASNSNLLQGCRLFLPRPLLPPSRSLPRESAPCPPPAPSGPCRAHGGPKRLPQPACRLPALPPGPLCAPCRLKPFLLDVARPFSTFLLHPSQPPAN